ncbi:MAG: ribosome silencing factor [Pseudomonadota bacterium]|nr:ribosome silencing factor [Pseudomonadota bacterium]
MGAKELLKFTQVVLKDLKARDIYTLDVQNLTSIADYLVIASGTSKRHVQSVSENLMQTAKQAGEIPIGIEGKENGEWVLIDLTDVVIHIMQPSVRELYKLEDLWSVGSNRNTNLYV